MEHPKNFKEVAIEILKTFSNQKSFFGSKRLERFTIFSAMLLLTLIYVAIHMINCTLEPVDFVIITSSWMTYAGFNTWQINREIKKDKPEENKEISDENKEQSS